MTLIYRALWQEEDPELTRQVRDQFLSWLGCKYPAVSLDERGRASFVSDQNFVDVTLDEGLGEVEDSAIMAVIRASLIETSKNGGARWETKIRAWHTVSDDDAHLPRGWVWADVAAVGEHIDPQTVSPAAPRIVRNLLQLSSATDAAGIPLDTEVLRYHGPVEGESLADLICAPERRLPLVVFADTDDASGYFRDAGYTISDIAICAQHKIAGIGRVAVADHQAVIALKAALGQSHAVWRGAFRIYMRDVDPAVENDSTRHRYVLPTRYAHRLGTAAHIIARSLSPVSAIQRPPPDYETAKDIVDRVVAGNDMAALYQLAIEENEGFKREVVASRERVNSMTEQIEGHAIDIEIMTDLLNSLRSENDLQRRHVEYLQTRLEKLDASDGFNASGAAFVAIPAAVTSASEAVSEARRHLSDYLSIPAAAADPYDMEKLDSARASKSIAAHSWHGFRALHAYAKTMGQPGVRGQSFWDWCKTSGDTWVWRATQTSLAMKESDSVANHPELRTFSVSAEVSPTGWMYMDKHLKFETNGEHAPRIYFHFDPHSCRVHVGYFGPHSKLKNSTN